MIKPTTFDNTTYLYGMGDTPAAAAGLAAVRSAALAAAARRCYTTTTTLTAAPTASLDTLARTA